MDIFGRVKDYYPIKNSLLLFRGVWQFEPRVTVTLQFVTVAGAVFYQNQNKNQYILQSVQRSKGQSMSKKESVNQCVCVCYLHAGWSSAGRWWRTFSQRNTGDVQLLLFPAEQRMWQELTRLNYWPILSSIFTRHHGHTLCQFLLRRKGYCKARRQNSAPPCDLVWYNFPF